MSEHDEGYLAIGLMSGTSHDGLDCCAARFKPVLGPDGSMGWQWAIEAHETFAYDNERRWWLMNLFNASGRALAKAEHDYSHWTGMVLRRFVLEHGLKPDLVAWHGHTLYHNPAEHYTYQLGRGEVLATYVDCPVVADFRTRDVAQGGQGAPLVPYGEQALFPGVGAFLNLGGIANLSLFSERLSAAGEAANWLRPGWKHMAYDVAACNQVLDALTQKLTGARFDKDGALARGGQLLPEVLAQLDAMAYYTHLPPRSMGREQVADEVLPLLRNGKPAADNMHTFCRHLAGQLRRELAHFGVRGTGLLVTGGGALNGFLMECIAEELAQLEVSLLAASEALISYKEALIFAFLGLQALRREANVLPEATGARRASILGSIHLPEGYRRPLLGGAKD